MPIDRIDILKARLQAIKSTLERAPSSKKDDRVGIPLAEDFNKIVVEIGELYPDLKDALPERLKATTFKALGQSDISYLDLEVFCEQVLNLLRLAE